MAYEHIQYEEKEGIAIITFNRPKALNAWKELAGKQLRGHQLQDLHWQTPEQIEVKPLYLT